MNTDFIKNDGVKKVIITYDSVFLNADSMFIEYNDVIKSPFFAFILSAQENEYLSKIFDISLIHGLSKEELYEWYICRNDQSLFLSLPLHPEMREVFKTEEMLRTWGDEYLYKILDSHPELVEYDTRHVFINTIQKIMNTKLVDKYYIYTPVYSKSIHDSIKKIFPNKISYVYGTLVDVLKDNKITSNSTFVFSDLKKIKDIKCAGILNNSSILIADRYGYNYNYKDYVIDPYDVGDGDVFKMNFFNNI